MSTGESNVGESAAVQGNLAPLRPALPPASPRPRILEWLTWVTRPIQFLDDKAGRFDDCFTVRNITGPDMVWFTDPESIKDIFTGDPEFLRAGEANFIVEGILGSRSLLLLDGEQHRRERKLMMPPFHGERMRAYGRTMRDLAAQTIDRWQVGAEISILPEMQAITLDVILRTVFGLDEGPRFERLRDLLRELLSRASGALLFGASVLFGPMRLQEMIANATTPIELPGGVKVDLSFLVPGGRLYKVMREVDALLLSEFARRREEHQRGEGGPREDVLSLLLDARDEDGAPMSDTSLRDELMTLLIAGHETTAITLSWAVHHLLRSDDARGKLEAELAPLAAAGPLQPETVTSLEYLDAVIKETMRLAPVIPLVARVLKKDMRIGKQDLPAGVMLMPCIYLTHRRAELWREPDKFRPEHFLERHPGPYEFFPFGGGNRRCIGSAFALYEMKIVLAEILTRVTLRALDDKVKVERRGITFAPSGGTRVSVEKKSDQGG